LFKRSHLIGRLPRRRGLRGIGLILLAMGLLLVGAYVYLTRPHRLSRLAGDLLKSMTSADAQIRMARIRSDGSIMLEGVELLIPDVQSGPNRLFEAEQVVIRHNLLSLMSGRFMPHSLTFFNPRVYITQDLESGLYNYQILERFRQGPDQGQQMNLPDRLPELYIRNGEVQVSEIRQGELASIGRVTVGGNLSADRGEAGRYYFSLQQQLPDGSPGPMIDGNLDLKTLAIMATLSGFTFDDPQRNFLPQHMREWWDKLEPTGELPLVRVGYEPGDNAGFFATLDVKNVAMTLPFDEVRSRMVVSQGRFTVMQNNLIRVSDLSGTIEGFDYLINGYSRGFAEDAAFRMSARIVGILPEKPRYLPLFPMAVQKQFKRFDPSGKFQADVMIHRDQPGKTIEYDGRLAMTNAKLRYWKFPYPLQDVSGEFRFNRQQLDVVSMRGNGPTGASVGVRGTITPPGPDAQVKITVTGNDLPLDEPLYQAMHAHQRRTFDFLFDRKAYARLTAPETGLLQSSEQKLARQAKLRGLLANPNPDEKTKQQIKQLEKQLARPVFDLGGMASIVAETTRPAGPKQPYSTTVTYQLRGVNLLLSVWPYPLHLTGGKFTVGPDGAVLEDIRMAGPFGGEGTINGTYHRIVVDGQKKRVPKIKFIGVDFPINELLLSALKDDIANTLRNLKLTGSLDVGGLIYGDEKSQNQYLIEAAIHDGSALPFNGQYRIDRIAGNLVIQPGKVQITNIEGNHNASRLHLSGHLDRADGGQTSLKLSAIDLRLQDPVVDLLPQDGKIKNAVRALLKKRNAAGLFDAVWTLNREGDKPAIQNLTLSPSSMSFDLKGQRVELTDVRGDLIVDQDGLHTDRCTAKFGTGEIQLSGHVTIDNHQPNIDVRFDAQNDNICRMTQAVLPSSVVQTIDAMALNGKYKISKARLSCQLYENAPPALDLGATVHLTDGKAKLGVDITELQSKLEVQVRKASKDSWPRLSIDMKADKLRAADRLIAPLTAKIANSPAAPHLIEIREIKGQTYKGQLLGNGTVDAADDGKYEIALTLIDAELEGILDPHNKNQKPKEGLINADIMISGKPDDINSRQGRGELAIRGAKMYQLPLTMALLQILNLSAPSSSSFDSANAKYILAGDDVTIESIVISSPTIDIKGSGKLKYSTLALDLNLATSNRAGLRLGLVSDLVKVVKDELVGIHVGGTLDKPKARLVSLGGIGRSIGKIFGAGRKSAGGQDSDDVVAEGPATDSPSKSGQ